jgi:hypothetical protein
VAALSLGSLTLVSGLAETGRRPEWIVHTAAGLTLVWSIAAWFVGRRNATQRGSRNDLLEVLEMAALTTGLLVLILMLYVASMETLRRTVYSDYEFRWNVLVWRGGLADLSLLGAACAFAYARTGNASLATATFWLAFFTGWWASLQLPGFRADISGKYLLPGYWARFWMLTSAIAVVAWTSLQGYQRYRWRVQAWPDDLDRLVTPAPPWPGFRQSAGLVAMLVVLLGCVHAAVPWTALGAFVTGIALLFLAGRNWSETLAELGAALITLGVVSRCMVHLDLPAFSDEGYPLVLNRAVVGLAVMTAVWPWLARVWRQQLDNGQAWTSAGRMIPVAQRVGFMVGALGVLLALDLAFWPRFAFIRPSSPSTAAWVWGIGADLMLAAALAYSMRGTNRSTVGWLLLFALAAAATFALVRAPGPVVRWWGLYWPLAIAGLASVVLLPAGARLQASAWRAMNEPLILTGVLLAPMTAISGVAFIQQLRMPLWVPPLTLGLLAGTYLIASHVLQQRRFIIASGLCAAAALWQLRDAW